MVGEKERGIDITFTECPFTLPLLSLEKVKIRFFPSSGLPCLSIPSSCCPLYEKNRIFPLCHQFPHLLFMPTLSSLSQCTPPSLHPPFTVTWLHLMTGLTPAYRIKLISTKQGSAEGGGRGGGGGWQREDNNRGSGEKYSRKKAQ